MISEFYGLKLPIAKFRELIGVDNQGSNIYGLVIGAQKIGFDAEALKGTDEELLEGILNREIHFPFIARIVNEQMFEHYVVVYEIRKGTVILGDPGKNRISKVTILHFLEQWQGQIITFLPNHDFEEKNERKGVFKKYFSFIALQKNALIAVFILSVVISAINISGAVIFEYILSDSLEMTEIKEEKESETINIEEHEHEHKTGFERTLDKIENMLSVVFANIKTVCVTIILMYILRAGMQILRGYLLAITAKQVDVPLTLSYYSHLVELPSSFFESRKTGEFMSRFYDTSQIRDAISTTALTIMIDTIMAVACGVLLYCINATLFFITVVIMFIYAIIMFLFGKAIKSVNHEIMEQEAQVTSYLKESIDGMETVKAYQYENIIKREAGNLYKEFANKNVKGSLINNFQETLVSVVAAIGVVILLWIGTYLCMDHIINIADLFIFYYLIGYFLDPVSNLINLQPELQTAMVAAERLNDILDADTEQNDFGKKEIENLQGDLKIENVDFRYGNRNLVLEDISMTFTKGKSIAIVGESGCGKTTIAKLLLSFYNIENGKITLNGADLSKYTISSIRKHIAYISQDIFLFSDTIYNNLKLGDERITHEEIERMCKLCRADEFIERFPLKYNTMLEENGNNLSGGQKQRLAIVRALLKKPDILILDEATSNLDIISEKSIKKMMESFSGRMTCIIIAHHIQAIKSCDYIYVMDKGKIVEHGTHQSLLDRNGLYKNFVECNI